MLTVLILLIAFVIAVFRQSSINVSSLQDSTQRTRARVLLITAHPDDECLFFAPTLLSFLHVQPIPEVFSLCLSIGDADGLGEIRKEEIGRSLDILGVDKPRRWVIDSPDLKDNITVQWSPQAIAEAVRPYVEQHRITTILTFDDGGVSGHPNHISLPAGAAHLLASSPAKPQLRPRLYTLVTVPLHSKYIGPFASARAKINIHLTRTLSTLYSQTQRGLKTVGIDIPTLQFASDTPVFVAGVSEYVTALQAMRQHWSQLVWFRWLYVLFSRYMWVNEWVELKVGDP